MGGGGGGGGGVTAVPCLEEVNGVTTPSLDWQDR